MGYGPIASPKLFRILVIDDQIRNDYECTTRTGRPAKDVQNAIERYFESVVKSNENNTIGNIGVEIKFAKDPEEGVYLWKTQIFDLTLVDSDFSKGETSRRNDSEKRNFLDLNLEFTGAYLYCFLRELSAKDKMREGCEIVLWTGLGLGGNKDERANDLLSILPSKQERKFDASWFIPKKEQDIEKWKSKVDNSKRGGEINVLSIESCLAQMKRTNPILNPGKATPETIIGRIKSLYRVKSPEEFASLCGLDKQVYVGWLKEERDKVVLFDERIDGGRLLSPLLRRGEDNDDFEIMVSDDDESNKRNRERAAKREIESEFFSKTLLDIRKKDGIVVPSSEMVQKIEQQHAENQDRARQKLKEHIIAAATPLTGCSAVGRDYSIALMVKKIKALLDGPFDKVVLKTVYLNSLDSLDQGNSLDQSKEKQWPEVQAQERHLTRCLRSTRHPRTLWSTGQTSLEAFTPEMMHDFLRKMKDVDGGQCSGRIIVSLGSKCQQVSQKIWDELFVCVFKGLEGDTCYPLVEINVRHYLREAIKRHVGGHEYLSPAEISKSFPGNYTALYSEFESWLSVVDKTAKKYGKRLLLKLPFRSDILRFVSIIRDFADKDKTSIAGITLINAFKSAAGETDYGAPYSPASYGEPDDDRKWCYQMSGEMLAASRNELMGAISALAKSRDLEIHFSGGIVDKTGLAFCLNCGGQDNDKVYAQIGTWALMDLNLSQQDWNECQKDAPSIGSGKLTLDGCMRCTNGCKVECPSGAFHKGGPSGSASIDRLKCTACQKCVNMCKCVHLGNKSTDSDQVRRPNRQLDTDNPQELARRIAFCIHELCNGCGKCSRTFYCDTFMDRRGLDLPPIMDARNCTGCGLCAQTCPSGAIQLFKPEHVAVLLGDDYDDLRRWHKFLFANEIPHLVFDSTEQEAVKASFLSPSTIIMAKGECSLEGLDHIRDNVKKRLEILRETV